MTCAPATLATLCRYWGRPPSTSTSPMRSASTGHRDTANDPGPRRGGDRAGVHRHARLRPGADRPAYSFTLSSVEPGNAHAQAVIGYDDHRGTLLIRENFERAKNEWIEEAAFKAQAPAVPAAWSWCRGRGPRLDGVPVDGAAYDLMHALDCALGLARPWPPPGGRDRLDDGAPRLPAGLSGPAGGGGVRPESGCSRGRPGRAACPPS
ncbi:MAG: hypothetical protein U1F77_12560 [Kiritimatiellia bacterium]